MIEYKLGNEAGFDLITSVIHSSKGLINIYKYKDDEECDKYFDINDGTTHIGYIINDTFYVISLNNVPFDEEFKNHFTFIDEEAIKSLKTDTNKRARLNKIPNFRYFPISKYSGFPPKCVKTVDIVNNIGIQTKLNNLNNLLDCINFKISIGYVFQMKSNTEIYSMGGFTSSTLLLCIFHDMSCVSSLTIKLTDKTIYIDSKTKEQYEQKDLNKLLRSIIIIIAKDLYPSAEYVVSAASNPTSSYLMFTYFNAVMVDEHENPIENNLHNYRDIKKYIHNHDGIYSKVVLNETNIKKARQVFETIVESKKYKEYCISGSEISGSEISGSKISGIEISDCEISGSEISGSGIIQTRKSKKQHSKTLKKYKKKNSKKRKMLSSKKNKKCSYY